MLSRSMKEMFYRSTGPLMRINGWVYRTLRAPTSGEVKVHLGPGQTNYLPGWYNVDANAFTAKIDVWADLRNPLPFRDRTVDAFYSHHVIEHLPDTLLRRHFDEMFRCLKPGGVIRIGGPDGGNAARKFAEGDSTWFGDFPDRYDSLGGKFKNFIVCRGEHLTVLTHSYLAELATTAGFINVKRCRPIEDTAYPGVFADVLKMEWEPTPEMPHTLLIEAEKPASGNGEVSTVRIAPPPASVPPSSSAPAVVAKKTAAPDGTDYTDWGHANSDPGCTWKFVLDPVLELCSAHPPPARVLDIGCGNGFLAGELLKLGYNVVGVDLSESGIAVCRKTYPNARFEVLPANEQVLEKLGEKPFDMIVSTEVVEHLYDPQAYALGCLHALRPGGRFVCSTPYHGYIKNLALAFSGKWDEHLNPMWHGGHIKFWSRRTLKKLLHEAGFHNVIFRGAGRAPFLWMSMVMSGDKPMR